MEESTIGINSFKALKHNKSLAVMILLSFVVVASAFTLTKFYLAYNERRIGFKLYDPIIENFGPYDLSTIIFICTYGCILMGLFFCMTSPEKIIRTNLTILCLLALRVFCMFMVPLEPPVNIIPLEDWLLMHTTYGNQTLMKDLFFSGHTASVVLLYHLVDNRKLSLFFLFMSIVIGSMLIMQHVHYTIDVICAYAFSHLAFIAGSWLTTKSLLYFRYYFIRPSRVA